MPSLNLGLTLQLCPAAHVSELRGECADLRGSLQRAQQSLAERTAALEQVRRPAIDGINPAVLSILVCPALPCAPLEQAGSRVWNAAVGILVCPAIC
jgi:hypothetical protein